MEEEGNQPIKEPNKKQDFESNLDSEFNVSKAWLGVLLSCVLLVFSPIVGAVKYPKGTKARKTYMRACLITLIVLAIIATTVGLLCYYFIFLIQVVAKGTVEGIVDGVVEGTKTAIMMNL